LHNLYSLFSQGHRSRCGSHWTNIKGHVILDTLKRCKTSKFSWGHATRPLSWRFTHIIISHIHTYTMPVHCSSSFYLSNRRLLPTGLFPDLPCFLFLEEERCGIKQGMPSIIHHVGDFGWTLGGGPTANMFKHWLSGIVY